DQTAILFHDDEWDGADIESLKADWIPQCGYELAALRELAPFAQRTTMILEVKRSRWEDVLLSQISEWPNIVVASFDHSTIAELHHRNVRFPLGLTIQGTIVDCAAYARRLGATWVFPNFRYVDEDLVRSLHENAIRVVPWTANRERDWERLRAIGCDGVITDYPAEAVNWRATKD